MMHIGKIIHEELKRQKRTKVWLAKQICCERSNIYSIIRRGTVDTGLLLRISKVLRHNFFAYYIRELDDCLKEDIFTPPLYQGGHHRRLHARQIYPGCI